MKKSTAQVALSFTMLLISIVCLGVSCRKDPLPVQPNPIELLPIAPVLNVKVIDTPLYNKTVHFKVVTDGQSVKQGDRQIVGADFSLDNMVKDTSITFIAINTNNYGSTTTATTVLVKVFSKNTTDLDGLNDVHQILSRSCVDGKQSDPNVVWLDAHHDCNVYRFYANGKSRSIIGSCYPPLYGTVAYGVWSWSDTSEKAIIFSGFDLWNITLYSNGFKRFRSVNGFYQEEVYEK